MQTQSVRNIDTAFAFRVNYEKARRGIPVKVDRQLEDKKKTWREKPELYAKERLKVDLTKEQIEVCYSVINNRRTAVKSHHSFGKTFVCAVILLWWIDCWEAHIGYITAPTWGQALRLTFKQAKRLAIANKLDFKILDTGWIKDKDRYKETERFIQALNADTGEGFQGEHTAPILIVKDESVGVPSYIHEAAEGLMTDEFCRMIEIGNATDESTEFGDNCSSPNYEVFTFSALDHQNIKAELKAQARPFPKAISLLWLFEKLRDQCDVVDSLTEDCFEFYSLEVIEKALDGIAVNDHSLKVYYKPNGYFQGRVLGEFPTEASNKVIPKGWLNNIPVKEINPNAKIQIGCDVARFGDDRTTIFARVGYVVLKAKIIRKMDNLAVTSAIKDMVRDTLQSLNKTEIKSITINIDITGGLGTAPVDLLQADGYSVFGINSSESAKNDELYLNKRSELWFDVADRFRAKEIDYSRLEGDVKKVLTKELATPLYKNNSRGKKVVEDKAEIKKRLKASPDLADGFNLAFYEVEGFEVSNTVKSMFGRT